MSQKEDPFGFRPLWEAILDVYKEMSVICDRHGLRYYAAYGTMLGAVRHNGFIPWDDDLDLMMPLEDFQIFCEVAPKELPDHLKLVTRQNTKGYPNLFVKIADVRCDLLDQLRRRTGLKLGQGIFIDIFVLVGAPDNIWDEIVLRGLNMLANLAYSYSMHGMRWDCFRNVCVGIMGFCASCIRRDIKTHADLLEAHWRDSMRLPFAGSTKCGNYYGAPNEQYMFIAPTRCFRDSTKMRFETLLMPVALGYEELLRVRYGDYMKLPSVECRVPSHTEQNEAAWLSP